MSCRRIPPWWKGESATIWNLRRFPYKKELCSILLLSLSSRGFLRRFFSLCSWTWGTLVTMVIGVSRRWLGLLPLVVFVYPGFGHFHLFMHPVNIWICRTMRTASSWWCVIAIVTCFYASYVTRVRTCMCGKASRWRDCDRYSLDGGIMGIPVHSSGFVTNPALVILSFWEFSDGIWLLVWAKLWPTPSGFNYQQKFTF